MSYPVTFLLLLLLLPAAAPAQELTPRAYWPAPVGTRIMTVGYLVTDGDTVPDPSLPVTGVDSRINSAFIAYRKTVDLWGRTANLSLDMPYAAGTTRVVTDEGLELERDYQGFGDLAATVSVNLLGAPAMNRQEFAQLLRDPHAVVGASIKLVAPTGRYDRDRIINVGANRWAAKAEVGYIQPLGQGWLLEANLGSWFFGDNENFLGATREQDPIVSLQAHLVHVFTPDLWASLDFTAYHGGRSAIDGDRREDLQRDSKLGGTLAFPIGRGRLLKLSYSNGSLNDSDEDFDVLQLSYSWVF